MKSSDVKEIPGNLSKGYHGLVHKIVYAMKESYSYAVGEKHHRGVRRVTFTEHQQRRKSCRKYSVSAMLFAVKRR